MADDPNDDNGFFEDDEFLAAEREDDEGNGDIPETKANLKEIWEQNPSLKIFAVVAVVAVFGIAFLVFGGNNKPTEESVVRQTAEVNQPAGTAELPPAYEEAVRQESERRATEAAETGGSAIPTPIARPSERIEAPVQVTESDPLSEWRKEAETRRAERQEDAAPPTLPDLPEAQNSGAPVNNIQQQQQPANPPLPTAPSPEMVTTMAQQLQQQMQMVLETQVPRESVVVSMNVQPGYDMAKYFPPEDKNAKNGQNGTTTNGTVDPKTGLPTTNGQAATPKPIVQAGTIAYAQVLTEANSDVPGPVLAEIASGPLSGARAIGQFQVAQRHLVLQFNRVVKDGVEYTTQAYALDPGTTLPGVVTDIDNHYFTRVFLPAAARFIQGFAQAATQTDTQAVVSNGTVVTNTTNDLNAKQELLQGVNEGAQELSEIIEQGAQRPRTIKVAAGTRIGLLFVNSVTDPTGQLQQGQGYPQQGGYANQAQNLGQQFFNVSPAGQAYNAYNAYANSNNQNNGGYYNGQQNQALQNTGTGQQFNYVQTPQYQTTPIR